MTQKKGRKSDDLATHWVPTALARNKCSGTVPIATWPLPQNVKAQVLKFIKVTYRQTLERLDNNAYIDSIILIYSHLDFHCFSRLLIKNTASVDQVMDTVILRAAEATDF